MVVSNKIPSVAVIGGGHAGVEAAYAACRLGVPACLITLRRSGIGEMSCNPSIGGTGKGHLVREIDALGGLMGCGCDAAAIQYRTLNAGKGAAVRATRAQADRLIYKTFTYGFLAALPKLAIIEAEAVAIEARGGRVCGVRLADGGMVEAGAVVLAGGTFLRAIMHTGAEITAGGRFGERPAARLSAALEALGFRLGRLKTGTPARLKKGSLDLDRLRVQPGDPHPRPFSILTSEINLPQLPCWITATNPAVHEIIRANRERSPLFNGQIRSRGPRYCPSIEDKVFRFPERDEHHIFLEPEGLHCDVIYPNGISTSLPADVQTRFIHLIPGLERAEIIRPGYAVEYDTLDPVGLKPTLESRDLEGFFAAGQVNGTSGYEEAAAQGLIAGANAALKILGRGPLVIGRDQGYIGVMIDDLITQGVDEPYRMFTARAEYRLLLREDNAALRLCPTALRYGLLDERRRRRFESLQAEYQGAKRRLESLRLKPGAEIDLWLAGLNSGPLKDSISAAELVRRPEIDLPQLMARFTPDLNLPAELISALETEFKFSGYLAQQQESVLRLRRDEQELIPEIFDYSQITGLRIELKEKLARHRPVSLGQALRIPGMTPGAAALIAIHLKRFKNTHRPTPQPSPS